MGADDAAGKSSENMLFKIANAVAQGFIKGSDSWLASLLAAFEIQLPHPGPESWDVWVNQLIKDKRCDESTGDLLKELYRYPFPLNMIYFVIMVLKVSMTDIEAGLDIYSLGQQYDKMVATTPHPAPVSDLVRSMIIDPARATENRAKLKEHGFNDTQIDNIILAQYRVVEEGVIRTNFLRKNITEEIMYERMRELGYTDMRIKEIILTWKVIPGPQDLFTMVAHEAFEPDIYKTLGLDKEFPDAQLAFMEANGISREWAIKYWIAHWEQPSIGQGFEMLHRNVITPGELDLLFKAVEIPDFWRDKLTQIAYNPYTRVDVRRMHDMGVLSDEDLYQAYKDIGFDHDKALNMVRFTLRFNDNNNKELTRGTIVSSYKKNLISRSEATDLLTSQDYTLDLADFYLSVADFEIASESQDLLLDNAREEYLLSRKTESVTRDTLNKLGLRGENINALLETWKLDIYKYESIPSKSDLDKFLVKGIITEGQYRAFMQRHGYSSVITSYFLQDLTPELGSPGRNPTRTDINNWYADGVILEPEWRTEMAAQGYSSKHIDYYFKSL